MSEWRDAFATAIITGAVAIIGTVALVDLWDAAPSALASAAAVAAVGGCWALTGLMARETAFAWRRSVVAKDKLEAQ